MKTLALIASTVLWTAGISLWAQNPPPPPSPAEVTWDDPLTKIIPFGDGAAPGTPVPSSGTPPIALPTGSGYPVTDVAAVQALEDIKAALKDSYSLLHYISGGYADGSAISKADGESGQRTDLAKDIGNMVEALAGDSGMQRALENISGALGNPASEPKPRPEAPGANDGWKGLISGIGADKYVSLEEYDDLMNREKYTKFDVVETPQTSSDGLKVLADIEPLTWEQQMQNWIAMFSGRTLPHPPPSGGSGATAGQLFDPVARHFYVEEKNPDQPDAPATEKKVARDPKLYVSATNQLAAIDDYFTIRNVAVTRRYELQKLLKEIVEEIKNAQNFASLGKLTALADLIEEQIQICNDDIHGAFNDVAVKSLQMFAMNQLKETAEQEKLKYEMEQKLGQVAQVGETIGGMGPTGPGGTTGGPTGGAASVGRLPWPIRR
jgi:hypothetical protein